MAGPGAYILGCAGPRLGRDEAAFFSEVDPWGFILFARNVETPAQVTTLVTALREAVGREAAVLIDQEGGRVQRLGPPHWREWLPPLDQIERAGPDRAARSMYLRYRIIAHELRALGIDVDCAPCADIATGATHPFLRNRCYGTEVSAVVELSRAVATGLIAGGVLPVLKHIPGHGRAGADSHEALPRVDAAPEDLNASDFAAFRALSDLPLGMTAHVVYSAFDRAPATVSPRILRLIREDIGFGGLLMTDDISMGALVGSVAKLSRASLAAGCDLILHCNGDLAEMEAVAAAAGRMRPEARARANRALSLRRAPEPIDFREAEAELEALLNGPGG